MVEADSTVFAESVLDVELFGHERGAFSGAIARKAGLIELAANGTLFIDEVGVLSAKLQSKLARALEHGSFFRVGGTQKVDIAVRLVTSSNHDLEVAVRDGRFRDDLLYRLNVVTVSLPPLRERAVDIPLLAQHFLHAPRRARRRRCSRRTPWRSCRSTRGPATFASCATSSSGWCCCARSGDARDSARRIVPLADGAVGVASGRSDRRRRWRSWSDSTSTRC